MKFKEIYSFPLKLDVFGDIVLTSDNERAFDFFEDMPEEGYILSNELQHSLIGCLNNENVHFLIKDASYIYKDASIYIVIDNKPLLFIVIRGWGYLTSTGRLQLPLEKAKQIQDEFAQFIIDKLSTYKK